MNISNLTSTPQTGSLTRSVNKSSQEETSFKTIAKPDAKTNCRAHGNPSAITKVGLINRKTVSLMRGLPQRAEEIFTERMANMSRILTVGLPCSNVNIEVMYPVAQALVNAGQDADFGMTDNDELIVYKKTALALTLAQLAAEHHADLEHIRKFHNGDLDHDFPDAFPITDEISVPWDVLLNDELLSLPQRVQEFLPDALDDELI